MRFEPLEDDKIAVDLRTENNFLGFDSSIAFIQEHNLFQTSLKNRRSRHHKPSPKHGFQIDIDEHPRLERQIWIVNRESHLNGACCRVDLRQNFFDTAAEGLLRIGIHRNQRLIARLEASNVALVDLSVYPNSG